MRKFQGPEGVEADLRLRLNDLAHGKLNKIVSRVSPFFHALGDALFLAIPPLESASLRLASAVAYLFVKASQRRAMA
jgi:hypothetical protein